MTTAFADALLDESLFEIQAVEVMRELRAAFLGVIDGFPQPPRRAAELARLLGVNPMLAWQIHRVATAPNPLAGGADMPGRAAVKQVLRAAKAAGVPEEPLERAARAMDAFEALVKRHADDRPTFDTMISGLADEQSATIDTKMRRQLYRLQSQAWGVHMKTSLVCVMYRPGSAPSVVDTVSIKGSRDIRRLRNGERFRLFDVWLRDSKEKTQKLDFLGDQEIDSLEGNAAILRKFSTQPSPRVDRTSDGETTQYFLKETPLGNMGAQTLYLAHMARNVGWRAHEHHKHTVNTDTRVIMPAEVLVQDTLFHRGMFGELSPDVTVRGSLSQLASPTEALRYPKEVLPIAVEVHRLGAGLDVLPTPHVPRYAEMVESVCRRIGWDPNDFEVFRCVLEYPMLFSLVSTRFPLPEKGSW